jgi:sporulation protein YlmC with PRC-barrel domain
MNTRHATFALAALATLAMSASVSAASISFITSQQSGEWMAHRLVGTKVLNAQAEDIGDVKDVVVDAKGTVVGVVIGVGGFLGLPEKLIGVPFSAIQIGDVVQSSRVVVLDTTKDALKAAPAYKVTDPATTDRVKQKASDWMTAAKVKVMELSKMAADKAKQMSAPKEPAATPAPATKP